MRTRVTNRVSEASLQSDPVKEFFIFYFLCFVNLFFLVWKQNTKLSGGGLYCIVH